MAIEKLKSYRTLSLLLSGIGILIFITTIITTGRNFISMASVFVAFTSFTYFLYTEAFLFPVPERSRISIWGARILCILSSLIVIGFVISAFR